MLRSLLFRLSGRYVCKARPDCANKRVLKSSLSGARACNPTRCASGGANRVLSKNLSRDFPASAVKAVGIKEGRDQRDSGSGDKAGTASPDGNYAVLVAFLGLTFIKYHMFDLHDTLGPSMLPTIMSADDVVAIDFASVQLPGGRSSIRRNEIVIAQNPSGDSASSTVCKRAVAFEGDVVVTRMGVATRVPPGHVWLEGDNPTNSKDSRSYGPVPLTAVVGRVFGIVSPPWRATWLGPEAERPAVSKWPESDQAVAVYSEADWEELAALEHMINGIAVLQMEERSSPVTVEQNPGRGEGSLVRQMVVTDPIVQALAREALRQDIMGGAAGAKTRHEYGRLQLAQGRPLQAAVAQVGYAALHIDHA